MASEKKKRKLKNAYLWHGGLKYKGPGKKRLIFFTPSERQRLKKENNND